MAGRLARHNHLLVEENPDGTVNVYTTVEMYRGLAKHVAGQVIQQLRVVPGAAAPPPPPLAAGPHSEAPNLLGALPAPTGVSYFDPFGDQASVSEDVESEWEKDARKYRPAKGRLLWNGALNIRASDPRLFFVAIPKKRGNRDKALAQTGYDQSAARSLAKRLFSGSTIRAISANASDRWPQQIRDLTDLYHLYSINTLGRMAEVSWTPEAIKRARVSLGQRGVVLVLGDPKSTRAQKVLTPAVDLARILDHQPVTEQVDKLLR